MKSNLMGINVNAEEINWLANIQNCKVGVMPFNYLGIPIGGSMSKISSWKPIIDKFRNRLSDWKAKTISIGERLCLCKTVLGSLGSYFFSLYKAPVKVLKVLESIRCRFFWGGNDDKKKIC